MEIRALPLPGLKLTRPDVVPDGRALSPEGAPRRHHPEIAMKRERTGGGRGRPSLWLTGAEGMLGHAFQALLEELGLRFAATDRDVDITERAQVLAFARDLRPTHIVNCAAFGTVDDAESHEDVAHAVNAEGAENLWLAALETGATLIHRSTDHVFDGSALEPYGELAPSRPAGAYGRSKREGEERILGLPPGPGAAARAYIVRTSWLYGPHGRNFVDEMLDLMGERDEISVVGDQIGRPTYAPDLAWAALALCGLAPSSLSPDERWGEYATEGHAHPHPAGIYHFANGGATSWHGFAVEILRQARALGLPARARSVTPVRTKDIPCAAPRPPFSVLDTTKIEHTLGPCTRPWQDALGEYLVSIQEGVAAL